MYIIQLSCLSRLQSAVHIKISPVFRNGRQIQAAVTKIVKLIQKSGDLVREIRKDIVLSQAPSVAAQDAPVV